MRFPSRVISLVAMSLAVSCATAPGVRTDDVAKLHYGDREEDVIGTLGQGSELVYFIVNDRRYHYRLYTAVYTKSLYALLFLEGELVAVDNQQQKFSNCLDIDNHLSWNRCVADTLAAMREHARNLGSDDFADAVEAEDVEQEKRDSKRGAVAAIAIPLTIAFPYTVLGLCVLEAYGGGVTCFSDPGAEPGDYQDMCIRDLNGVLAKATDILQKNSTYNSIVTALDQMQLQKGVIKMGKAEQDIADDMVLYYSWGCRDPYHYLGMSDVYLTLRTGLSRGVLKWAWLGYEPRSEISRITLENAAKQGDAESQLQLFYLNPNSSDGLRWLCRAADQGQSHAQNELAGLYWKGGRGIGKDLSRAYMWYALAIKNGHDEYSWKLEKLKGAMTSEQIVRAKVILAQWRPGQCEGDLAPSGSSD